MTVAEALKRFRAEYKLSQKEVASAVGMVPTSYYRYESGRYLPQTDIIIKLAETYDVSADYLLGLSDEPRPKPANKVLVEAIINCRDSIQKVLEEADKITEDESNVHLQNHEQAQRQDLHRSDAAGD